MLLSGVVGLVKITLYAKVLSPGQLGYYSLSLLLSTYGMYICSCGLYEGSIGIFPRWYGEGRSNEVESARNTIAGFTALSTLALLLSLGLVITSDTLKDMSTNVVIFLAGLFAGGSTLFVLLLADIRSRLMTLEFGTIIFLRSILSLSLGTTLAHQYGYIGILVSEIIITTCITAIIAKYKIHNFAWNLSGFVELKPIFRVGLPLMLNGVVTNAASNIDRFFVISTLGDTIFGYYSFAMILATGGSLVQSILSQHIGPEILYRIGQGDPPKELLGKLNRCTVVILVSLVLLWYPFSLIVEWIIPNYFPEYLQAYSIIPIIYVGASVIVVSYYENFIVAFRKTEYLLILNIAIVAIVLGLSLLCSFWNLSLVSFAIIYVIGRILYFIFTLILTQWSVNKLCLSVDS
ncbi:lipopolysaccharide biosynthesis protein [Coleofasciculus sp.]|uniref:lipopolysaccharide biosynthesis protein n=1 Tax=Coleofasciculus sp. TaxID=3100458 RepID=UPI0039F9C172